MSDSLDHLEQREDLAATSDPALQSAADRGEAHLLSYNELYRLWERQQWSVYELDFTQDRIDAVAAAKLVGAKQIIPCHYNTFPPIETDAEQFKNDVKDGEVVILDPGDTHSI